MMLITSSFEPTIDNAPCPPFFVENVYDIFINATQENNLTSNVTVAVWEKCVQQFPQLSTTTSTTPTTTTTTEQTTTSTTPTTTTTTEQTTTSTTPTTTTTTTTEQTTTSTTPTTTTTTEQTAPTTPTTTTTTKQTTTSKTPSTTADTHTTSTGKITTKPVTTFSTTKASSETSTAITFSVTNVTTVTPSQQASLKQCDGFCLLGVIMFSFCIFVGVLVTVIAVKCYSSKRKKNVNINDNIWKNRNGKVKSVNYRQKFPKMSRQADFNSTPLAFENPTFIGHNGFIPGIYTNTDQYNHSAHASEITHNYKRFPDVERDIYQVHVYPGHSLNPVDAWMSSSSNNAGFMNSYKRPYKKRHRHSSIGSHVPKILLHNENDYSFGVVSYDDNFGLPKLDIGHYDSDIDIPDYPGLPRIPLEENINNTETGFNDSDIDIPDYPGLPRIPLEENINNTETGFNIEQRQTVEKQSKNETDVKLAVRHGFPRIPIESIGNGGGVKVKIERKGLPRTEIKETENNEGFDSYKKLLHRTPF